MSKEGQEIPQGQPQDVIGGGIDGSVVKQLIAREKLISNSKKDNNQLLFYNGNGAWARLVSSVNTLDKAETEGLATGTKTIKDITGTSYLANHNVLMGGSLKQGTPDNPTSLKGGVNENLHNPINIDSDGYILAGDINNSAYNKYESLGFRPTPGINSVSVKSKGTYGSLREAEVNVTVWTLEDLEMMQALYLRPGYTILLEWGHSLQLDSETGNVNKDIQLYRKFLQGKVPRETIQEDLREIAFDSDYNYDAMVGFVSNFNWSFREDGGYDCMVKIISSGTILESIAVTFDTSNTYPPDQMKDWDEDKGKKERKSIYHKLFVELEHLVGNPDGGYQAVVQETSSTSTATGSLQPTTNTLNSANPDTVNAQSNGIQLSTTIRSSKQEPIYTKESFLRKEAQHFKKTLNSFIAFRLVNIEEKDTGAIDNDNLNEFWIPLYVVLDIYNQYVSLLDATSEPQKGSNTPGRKLTQFYTGFQDQDTSKQKYDKKCKYLTNELHFSIDPMVCVLPRPLANIALYDSKGQVVPWKDPTIGFDTTSYAPGLIYKNGFHKNVAEAFEKGLMRGETDDILNILISCQFLQTELDKIVESTKDSDQNENNDMVSFMRTLLRACNEAMGSINDLDLFYDEKDDLFYIVDRKVTPPLRNLVPTISLTGIRSNITKLSIESKISSNIGNMISIAAQGTGGHTKDNIAPLLEWNRGLLDRHIVHKSQKNDENGQQIQNRESPEDARLKKWTLAYYKFWEEFNGNLGFWFDDGDYDRQAVSNIKGYHKEFCQKWVVEKRSKDPNDPIPAPGVIPIELSFTTMGIGGLKIGQAFLIEEGILPQQYSENFGFIITGLSHSISDGKWNTDVKTQFYSTRKPTAEEIAYFKEKFGVNTVPYRQSNNTGGSSTGGGTSAPVVTQGQTVFTSPDLYIPPNGRVTYASDISKQKRSVPVQKRLMDILAAAAEECNVRVSVTSAGNVPRPQRDTALFAGNGIEGKNSLGSVRHDNGFAADIKIYDSNGQLQNVSEAVTPVALQFFKAIRRLGVHCIGTGRNYMGGVTAHIDICAGNSKTGTIKTNFTASSKGPTSSWLRQFMKDTRTTLNAPSGTAGGQTFKCYD